MNETCSKNLHQTVSRTWSTCTSNHTNAEAIVLIIDPVILAQSSYEEMAATSSPLESNQNSNSSHPAAVGTAASAENNADTSTAPRSTTSTLTVASLRRSNSHAHHSPTRVLRLTEQEERARTPPARNLSSLTLNHRPRSNPRTRTPRRAESPLDPNALRREDAASIPRQQQPRTITIRPHAGSAVGSLPTLRVRQSYFFCSNPRKEKGASSLFVLFSLFDMIGYALILFFRFAKKRSINALPNKDLLIARSDVGPTIILINWPMS